MTVWLLATELGGGFGHLVRLHHLARALRRRGDRIVLACQDVALAAGIFGRTASAILRGPALPIRRARPLPGFAGILEAFGFADPRFLLCSARRWRRIFADTGADAVIADFAPFATFAARGRLPVAVVGSGFDLPPLDGPRIPPFAVGDPPADEAALLASARRVARMLGQPPPPTLACALHGDQRHLVGLPWIDPFDGRRRERALGPLGPRPPLRPAPAEGRIFAYADPDAPYFRPLLLTLARLPVRSTVYWRGGPDAMRALLRDNGVEAPEARPDPALLAQATLVVSHGGAGLIADAILAGRPHLCLPWHREAMLNARALAATGAGLAARDDHPDTIAWSIRSALSDIPLRDRALELGEIAAARYPRDPASALARRLCALTGRAG